MHPGEGLQVLEIQERLYGFLLACCRDILHDVSEKDLRGAPVQPGASLAVNGGTGYRLAGGGGC